MAETSDLKRLNILFLPAWYPSDRHPIMGTFVREHAKAAARYHNVSVLYASRGEKVKGGIWGVTSDRMEDGIRIVRINWRGLRSPVLLFFFHLWGILAAYRYLQRTGFQADIIHAHIYVAAPAAVLLGKLLRKPVIVTEQTSLFLRGDVKGQQLLVTRWALRRANMILPVSAWLQQSMQSVGVQGKYRVVPNTVDTELFFPLPDGHMDRADDMMPRLLTVGLLTEPKGIPVLLRAVHILKRKGKRFHLDIVGDGRERADYEKISIDLGLHDVVTFHGLKDKAEVAGFMRRCAFYIQASLWETFCAAIVEAMACGKPIVGTQIPVFEEKVGKAMGILVPPGDEDALASAMEDMLERYESFDGNLIAETAHKRFGHDAVGKALSDVYDEVRRQC
ncbi:MAG: glycosyltransferase [Anaerolineales bacterium]|jgi:glycosyltransferase involved in cell wall biosynthesis